MYMIYDGIFFVNSTQQEEPPAKLAGGSSVERATRAIELRFLALCVRNPVRIPRPKIDKLACQAQGVGIFAAGEILVNRE